MDGAVMGTQKMEGLLRDLAEHGIERARPGLAQRIKDRIPPRLVRHRMDTISIIVDLRISRVAAAAVILVVMLVLGHFLGGRDAVGTRMLQDSKLLLQYTLAGENAGRSQMLGNLMRFRDEMTAQGREVVYYGDLDLHNRYAIIMHWKLSEDKYGVVLGDLSARTVSANTLITLQSHMLQSRARNR
jgi:hypothetical protein